MFIKLFLNNNQKIENTKHINSTIVLKTFVFKSINQS